MNLELLNPFGRQIPDRIDSTLSLPASLHFRQQQQQQQQSQHDGTAAIVANTSNSTSTNPKSSSSNKKGSNAAAATSTSSSSSRRSGKRGAAAAAAASAAAAAVVEDVEWKAAYHVSYNRRGTYLAVGYGSSTVAVFNTLSRTLAALYQSDSPDLRPGNIQDGVTSLTWSRRSRTLLCGAAGDAVVRLYDSSHHFGPDQACKFVTLERPMLGGSATDGTSGGGGSAADAGENPNDDPSTTAVPRSKASKSKSRSAAAAATASSSQDANTTAIEQQTASSTTTPAILPNPTLDKTRNTSFVDPDVQYVYGNDRRSVATAVWEMGEQPPTLRPPPTPNDDTNNDDQDSQVMDVEETAAGKDRPRRRSGTKTARSPVPEAAPELDDGAAAATTPDDGVDEAAGTREPNQHVINTSDDRKDVSAPAKSTPHKHPCVSIEFDHPVGGALQVHPRISTAGLAALTDGTLVLFYVPPDSFVSKRSDDGTARGDESQQQPLAWIVPLIGPGVRPNASESSSSGRSPTTSSSQQVPRITCASFDHRGENVFAATKDGTLFGFHVQPLWIAMQQHWHSTRTDVRDDDATSTAAASAALPVVEPHVRLSIGGSTAWHLLVSRNGKDLVVNSSDGALRLFKVADLMAIATSSTASASKIRSGSTSPGSAAAPTTTAAIKPMVFQDVVSKVKFACCDLSGDGEHLVGGANGDDTKYRLYLWSTATGVLLDKLTGPPLQLYSVAWHPSRSFVAVATSDGLVDVWGPRVNWTAFAPDFQALPHNVEYVEREDEFDVDESGRYLVETLPSTPRDGSGGSGSGDVYDNEENSTEVDVTTIEKVPVFASDSEEEEDVFHYDVRLVNLLADRKGKFRDKSMDIMAD